MMVRLRTVEPVTEARFVWDGLVPLSVQWGEGDPGGPRRFVQFGEFPTQVFELVLDHDGRLRGMTLKIPGAAVAFRERSAVPAAETAGQPIFEMPNTSQMVESVGGGFSVTLFQRGIHLAFRQTQLSSIVKAGRVVFEFDAARDLVGVAVVDLSSEEEAAMKAPMSAFGDIRDA